MEFENVIFYFFKIPAESILFWSFFTIVTAEKIEDKF